MDENEILVTSIGEQALAYMGRDNISRLSIELLPGISEAHLLVAPSAADMKSHLRLLEKFAEIEDMFEDEVAMSIRLVPANAPDFDVVVARKLAFTA